MVKASKVRFSQTMGGILLMGLVLSVSAQAIGVDAGAMMSAQCDNIRFLADQLDFDQNFIRSRMMQKVHTDRPEHICGTVVTVFQARRSMSGWHGEFLMSVGKGAPVRIVSNLDEMNAPVWPWVRIGDAVEVQGRYYYDNPRRQGVDWTHHGTNQSWPWPGFVVVHGQKYQ